jgi:cbb3-type cytochrome oxidase subunit 3
MDPLINRVAEYGLYLLIPLAFLAVVAWIYRPSAKKHYLADGNIPFYGDTKDDKTRQGVR